MPASLWPLVMYLVVFALNAVVPGRWVDGYVTNPATGAKYRYHLNGLRVLILSVGMWALACWQGLLEWNAFYLHRWELVLGACVTGLVASAAIVMPATPVEGSNLFKDLFLGRIEQPQLWGGRVDAKMYLYLVGAVILELNLLSFAAHHLTLHRDDPNPGVFLYTGLFTFFLCEYLFFEEVHLYTYDFVAERVGFKLTWGCLVFYPYFYGVGLWALAELPNPHVPNALLPAFALVFFVGWIFARGANMQKYWFKRDPTRRAFGLITPIAIEGRVLMSGFWGLSRHVNYLGELLMASGLALSFGYVTAWQPWLYPLYYVALLFPRQLDDDRRCAKKYGHVWDAYVQRVPWRIIPFVY
jgi:protein-S-isoprenylcysteine O-methyltransferase Ste14